MTAALLTVIVCTNRPARARRTVDHLLGQQGVRLKVLVIDDSAGTSDLGDLHAEGLTVVANPVPGLSRARNLGWQVATTDWVVYVDDDVIPDDGWAVAMADAVARHPEADMLSCDVRAPSADGADELVVSDHRVDRERVIRGRWVKPWLAGLTFCLAVRRSTLARLGGFDERLGPGVAAFPSAEDMDLNYRLLRSGGTAVAVPEPTATHEQWRRAEDLPRHFRGYMAGWSGFAMKHLRSGDVAGGLWLWSLGLDDLVRMGGSAVKRRSLPRLRVTGAKLVGLAVGTVRGLLARW